MDDFTIRYSSTMYLRDEDGRSFTQPSAIASGAKKLKNDSMFVLRMIDGDIAELDPVTCAACDSSDLST